MVSDQRAGHESAQTILIWAAGGVFFLAYGLERFVVGERSGPVIFDIAFFLAGTAALISVALGLRARRRTRRPRPR